jgi:hypothetical protein
MAAAAAAAAAAASVPDLLGSFIKLLSPAAISSK